MSNDTEQLCTDLQNFCKKIDMDTPRGRYSAAESWRVYKGAHDSLDISQLPEEFKGTYIGMIEKDDLDGTTAKMFIHPKVIKTIEKNIAMRDMVKMEMRWCHMKKPKSVAVMVRATIVWTAIGKAKYGEDGERYPAITIDDDDVTENEPEMQKKNMKNKKKKDAAVKKPLNNKQKTSSQPNKRKAKKQKMVIQKHVASAAATSDDQGADDYVDTAADEDACKDEKLANTDDDDDYDNEDDDDDDDDDNDNDDYNHDGQ